MEITLRPTTKIVTVNGVEARIWEGWTSTGIRLDAYITRVRVSLLLDQAEFEKELLSASAPSPDVRDIPPTLLI